MMTASTSSPAPRQLDLFTGATPAPSSGACIEAPYQYASWHIWNYDLPRAAFILAQPLGRSRAAHATLIQCITLARTWERGGLVFLSLNHDLRTAPATAHNRVGPDAARRTLDFATQAADVLAAWGDDGQRNPQARVIAALLRPRLTCLGLTEAGAPVHPRDTDSTTRYSIVTRKPTASAVG